ncbi:MAG TPA: LUD domain-containing protein [Chitinophagales bacterium]|nr:LUD domain-containing protein [Chitinophagales bacterium]
MAKILSSKEKLLSNVRGALLHQTRQPYPNLENNDSFYAVPDEPLEIIFATEFTAVNGQFVFCETEKECVDTLKELIEHKQWKNVSCPEPELHSMFDRFQFINYETDIPVTGSEVSVMQCEALIARTGSILISSRQASGRTLPVFPPVNIVIASTRQLVMDINDGFAAIRKKYDGNFPSMVNLNTGPSRTADIEKTLVLGAHGPREVYVFLIENWPVAGTNGEK